VSNNHKSCPKCQALNHSSQKECEACGSSMEWVLWNRPPARRMNARQWGSMGLVLGGIFVGFLGAHYSAAKPPTVTPPPLVTSSAPEIDVVFVIDTTGSMGDEIQSVKSQVVAMMEKVQQGTPRPYVRFGIVAYRDQRDEYVTKGFPLTADVQTIQDNVMSLRANGGGDTPEAVAQAVHTAVYDMNWSPNPNAKKLMFLIGDAGPHHDQPKDPDLQADVAAAKSKGIKLHTWGCSGIVDSGESEFRELAAIGGGDFQMLTYQQEVADQQGRVKKMVFQGTESYVLSDSKADWTVGADKLGTNATVCKSVAAPRASGAARYSEAGFSPRGEMTNNLDRVLMDQVKCESAAAGVKY
jgi:Mg-chelatase subunit ChlD